MASESMNAKQARNRFTKGKRQQHQQIKNRSSPGDGDGEDSFIFETNEAWKDFHGSLLQFYENGELCDITLKVELVARACCEYMKLHFHPSSCLAVRVFAESHSRTDLMDMVDQYACEHFPEVVECEDFVHLPLLPGDFLMGAVAKEQIVKENLKCRDLLDEARNYHLHLSSRAVPDFEYSFRTTPRKHTAGVLFYVGGQGGSGDPFRSIECYSINKNSWFFGPETNSRRRHVGVISVEGKVYAVGGHDGNEHLGSMEMFDCLTIKWMMKVPVNTKR